MILGILGPQQSAIFSPRAKPLTGRHFAPMPGGRLQAASDATRTEAVALVEAKVPAPLNRRHYALLFDSAERSHWVMCAPVSACSARLRIASRTIPGGSALASSRSRVACSTSRSSKGCFWLKRCWYCGERCCRFCKALHPSIEQGGSATVSRSPIATTDGAVMK